MSDASRRQFSGGRDGRRPRHGAAGAVQGVSGRLMIALDTNNLAHAIHEEEPDDATQWQQAGYNQATACTLTLN